MVDHKLKVDSMLIFFCTLLVKLDLLMLSVQLLKLKKLNFAGDFCGCCSSFFSFSKLMAFFDLRCYLSVFSGLFPSLDVSKGLQSSV